MLIASSNEGPFVQDGDSGSLVVSGGFPAGMIIAKSERSIIPNQPRRALLL